MQPANGSRRSAAGATRLERPGRWTARVTRAHLAQMLFFGLNGLFAGIVYSAAAWSLIALSPETFGLDIAVAYALSAVGNYLGSRLVFRPSTGIRGHALRYLTVIGANFLTAAFLGWWMHQAGAANFVSVYLPVAVTAGPTFVMMRSWAFRF